MDGVTFDLDSPTILLNKWQRLHWAARRKHNAELSILVRHALGRRVPAEPWEYARVIVERRSVQIPDWDGLYGGLKPLLDCLVRRTENNPHGVGLIEDDSPTNLIQLLAVPVRVRKRADQGTTVSVERVGKPLDVAIHQPVHIMRFQPQGDR